MDGPDAYPSDGEATLADYLINRRIRFEYEPQIGTRHPDLLAHAPGGDVVKLEPQFAAARETEAATACV